MIDLFNVFVKKSSAHTHSICHRLFLVLPVKHPISLCFALALSAFFFKAHMFVSQGGVRLPSRTM